MDTIKPRINLAGYKKALQEYGQNPSRIIEELVANSYDADATTVLVLHSEKDLVVVDNGSGISDEQFPKLLDLGAGTKIGAHDSDLNRSYLGSFGFGIKSTVNIAKTISIFTGNKSNALSCEIDVAELEGKGFKDDWQGFPINSAPRSKVAARGTMVWLKLRNELSPELVEQIKDSLYNLPRAKDFSTYLVAKKKAGKSFNNPGFENIAALRATTISAKKDRITGTLEIGAPKVVKCNLAGSDSIDVSVWCSGLDSKMKVESLGQFAGVYVKVDGRVLKRNFQGEKVIDGVSKYPKFKHGMRVEVPIDWLKDQISLGRDGLQFGNEASKRKFENELKTAVTAAVRPYAKQLEDKKLRKASHETQIREKKAKERINKKQQIKSLVATGYAFVPTDDYEMALLLANPAVLKKISPTWVLMDFNGQLDFDCLVYDKKTTNYVRVELEPKLESFLSQGLFENTDVIVSWTRGEWKVGRRRKGKRGYYEIVESDGQGHYKLLVSASEKSKEPKFSLPVYCVDQLIKA
jgi:hypothetical protein